MQVCIGIRQPLQQGIGAYPGPVYLETMMMLHLSGHWSGSLLLESLQFTALKPQLHTQVLRNIVMDNKAIIISMVTYMFGTE